MRMCSKRASGFRGTTAPWVRAGGSMCVFVCVYVYVCECACVCASAYAIYPEDHWSDA